MNRTAQEILVNITAMLILAAILVVLFWIGIKSDERKCELSWRDSGYESRYVLGSGCQIKTASGAWVPDKAMRGEVK